MNVTDFKPFYEDGLVIVVLSQEQTNAFIKSVNPHGVKSKRVHDHEEKRGIDVSSQVTVKGLNAGDRHHPLIT